MNEKIFSEVHTTPFTTHYTVICSDGSLECRTVHRCPKCGTGRLIVWRDSNSMLFADIVFGFRKIGGVPHIQSYCRSCRSKGV